MLQSIFPRPNTRYLPRPSNRLSSLHTLDFRCPFSPEEILTLVKQSPPLVIEDSQVNSRIPESDIAGAMERMEFKLGFFGMRAVRRGNIFRIKSAITDPGYYDHVMVVSNSHWMNAEFALV